MGATGVVGRELVELLTQAAKIDKVISITRRPIEYTASKVINKVVNFDQLDKYASTFKGDILFSCLGTTLKLAGSIEQQRLVDVNYQYQAAEFAVNNGVSHYLLVSSSGASVNSHSGYLKMKGELEEQTTVLNFSQISIIQPSLLLGERKDFRLGEKLVSALLPLLSRIPALNKYRPITGKQVATKMCCIALSSIADNIIKNQQHKIRYYRLDELFDK